MLVGSPGTAEVFVYDANSTVKNHMRNGNQTNEGGGWEPVAVLTHSEAKYPQHRFGTRGAIAIEQVRGVGVLVGVGSDNVSSPRVRCMGWV